MTVSVVIPAHGREDLLIRGLASLAPSRQGGIAAEVCVVDDGSGLDEARIRKAAGDGFAGEHDSVVPPGGSARSASTTGILSDGHGNIDSVPTPARLVWRAFPSPKGRSAARNEGIRATSGDIVVFHDSDMEAEPGFLAAHIAVHRKHPHTAAVGGILWPRGGSFLRYIGTRGAVKLKPGDTMPPWYFVTGNASVERRDLPPDNPFDETIPGWGGEDLALGIALAGMGVEFTTAPDAVSFHHFTGTLEGHLKRTRSYGRDSLPVLVRNHPEVRRIVRLHLLDSPFWRAVVSDAAFRPAAALARLCDALPLPAALYDYLTFAAYGRGWLEANMAPGKDART